MKYHRFKKWVQSEESDLEKFKLCNINESDLDRLCGILRGLNLEDLMIFKVTESLYYMGFTFCEIHIKIDADNFEDLIFYGLKEYKEIRKFL